MFIWEQNTEEHLENVTYPVFALACRVTQSATQRKKKKERKKKREETKLCPVMIDFSDSHKLTSWNPFLSILNYLTLRHKL